MQKKDLNITLDQIIRHIRKLKSGKLKTKIDIIIKKPQKIDSHIAQAESILNSDSGYSLHKKWPYTKWKELDEELKKIINDETSNSYVEKAISYVTKNPIINKTTIQIAKQMKLILYKSKVDSSLVKKSNKEKRDQFAKYLNKLKDTPTFVCAICERYGFLFFVYFDEWKNCKPN